MAGEPPAGIRVFITPIKLSSIKRLRKSAIKQWIEIQRIACAEARRKGFKDPDTIEDLLQSVSLALLAEQERNPALTLDDMVARARCRTLDAIKAHRRAEYRQQQAIDSQSVVTVRVNRRPLF